LRTIINHQAGSGFQVAFSCLSPAFLLPFTLAAFSRKKHSHAHFTFKAVANMTGKVNPHYVKNWFAATKDKGVKFRFAIVLAFKLSF